MREGVGFGRSPKASSRSGPLCQAIAQRRCVSANEGNVLLVIAPHAVFRDTDGLRLAGGVVEENGAAVDPPRWSVLKLADLTYIVPVERRFEPHGAYDPEDPLFGSDVICRLSE